MRSTTVHLRTATISREWAPAATARVAGSRPWCVNTSGFYATDVWRLTSLVNEWLGLSFLKVLTVFSIPLAGNRLPSLWAQPGLCRHLVAPTETNLEGEVHSILFGGGTYHQLQGLPWDCQNHHRLGPFFFPWSSPAHFLYNHLIILVCLHRASLWRGAKYFNYFQISIYEIISLPDKGMFVKNESIKITWAR